MSEPPHPGAPHHDDHDGSDAWWRNVISNWSTYEAPFGTKLRLAGRNMLLRARLRPCCGHPGEPGC